MPWGITSEVARILNAHFQSAKNGTWLLKSIGKMWKARNAGIVGVSCAHSIGQQLWILVRETGLVETLSAAAAGGSDLNYSEFTMRKGKPIKTKQEEAGGSKSIRPSAALV